MNSETPRSLARVLALNRGVGVVLVSVLFFGLGEQLWSQFMPIWLDARIKQAAVSLAPGEQVPWSTLALVGIYACLRNLLEGFCYIGGGQLTARLGDRGSIICFGALTVTGYTLFLTVPLPWVALLAAVMILGWEPLSVPVTFTTVGATLEPARRGMAFALQSIQKRLPKIIGPVVAGYVLAAARAGHGGSEEGYVVGMRILVGLALILAMTSLAIQIRWMPHHPLPPSGPSLPAVVRAFPPRLRRLLIAEVCTRWCDWLVREFVVLYVMLVRGKSATEVGLLFGLQNFVALLTYLPIGRMTQAVGLQPFIGLTFIFFALFPLTLALAPGDLGLVLAFIVNGLREIGEPARKALITALMPEDVRARGIGMYWGLRSFGICWASLVGAFVWQHWGPEDLLYGAFALGCVGAGVFYAFCREKPSA